MVSVTRYAITPLERVFEVISDPTTYPDWLVGAKEIRSVDDDWPKPGSRFHHRVGLIGPLTVADSTKVIAVEAPVRLSLEVRARPFVRGRADFHLARVVDADGTERTSITMEESVIGAAASLAAVLEPPTKARNQASLNALVAKLNEPEPF